MKSYKAKSVILANLGLLDPLWALGTQRVFFEKIFYSAQLDMKIQLAPKFQKKQAAHAWSPSVCESQWGAGKNEFMAKSFFAKNHGKITKSQPPLWGNGKNSENVICN